MPRMNVKLVYGYEVKLGDYVPTVVIHAKVTETEIICLASDLSAMMTPHLIGEGRAPWDEDAKWVFNKETGKLVGGVKERYEVRPHKPNKEYQYPDGFAHIDLETGKQAGWSKYKWRAEETVAEKNGTGWKLGPGELAKVNLKFPEGWVKEWEQQAKPPGGRVKIIERGDDGKPARVRIEVKEDQPRVRVQERVTIRERVRIKEE
jgi:hypothetical protein